MSGAALFCGLKIGGLLPTVMGGCKVSLDATGVADADL